jgi:hypothetical protein
MLAGLASLTVDLAVRAHSHLIAADFADQRCWRVVVAALGVPDGPLGQLTVADLDDVAWQRVDAVARRSGVAVHWVRTWARLAAIAVDPDIAVTMGRRVRVAARQRAA